MESDAGGFSRVVVDVEEEYGDCDGCECIYGSGRRIHGTGARVVKRLPLLER